MGHFLVCALVSFPNDGYAVRKIAEKLPDADMLPIICEKDCKGASLTDDPK
jgi:hypothetical protein